MTDYLATAYSSIMRLKKEKLIRQAQKISKDGERKLFARLDKSVYP